MHTLNSISQTILIGAWWGVYTLMSLAIIDSDNSMLPIWCDVNLSSLIWSYVNWFSITLLRPTFNEIRIWRQTLFLGKFMRKYHRKPICTTKTLFNQIWFNPTRRLCMHVTSIRTEITAPYKPQACIQWMTFFGCSKFKDSVIRNNE